MQGFVWYVPSFVARNIVQEMKEYRIASLNTE
jgi:hypothetical protein